MTLSSVDSDDRADVASLIASAPTSPETAWLRGTLALSCVAADEGRRCQRRQRRWQKLKAGTDDPGHNQYVRSIHV